MLQKAEAKHFLPRGKDKQVRGKARVQRLKPATETLGREGNRESMLREQQTISRTDSIH